MKHLNLKSSTDAELIERILKSAADKIAHDERAPSYIDHPAVRYWIARRDKQPLGVFMGIWHGAFEVEVHCVVLNPRLGRKLGAMFLDLLWRDQDLTRITAPVLSSLPSAANFCRRLGFVDEGVKRQACKIGGVPTNVVMLGMLRSEWLAKHDAL